MLARTLSTILAVCMVNGYPFKTSILKRIALDFILGNTTGRLISLRNGIYDHVPLDIITGRSKVIDVPKYYDVERMRPKYESFIKQPMFIMTGDD